jgi:urea carboxylase
VATSAPHTATVASVSNRSAKVPERHLERRGYQLIGRTLPIFYLEARNSAFAESPFLVRAGDRVKFEQVEEGELDQMWEDSRAGRYRYEIEDDTFDVGAYLEWLPEVQEEAAERRRRWEEASAATPVP